MTVQVVQVRTYTTNSTGTVHENQIIPHVALFPQIPLTTEPNVINL